MVTNTKGLRPLRSVRPCPPGRNGRLSKTAPNGAAPVRACVRVRARAGKGSGRSRKRSNQKKKACGTPTRILAQPSCPQPKILSCPHLPGSCCLQILPHANYTQLPFPPHSPAKPSRFMVIKQLILHQPSSPQGSQIKASQALDTVHHLFNFFSPYNSNHLNHGR
jgi:hypothetical protein